MSATVQERTYKSTPQGGLSVKIYAPESCAGGAPPAIVFFYGGGWTSGDIDQFKPQSEYLASRGMAAFCAEYRTKSKHGTTPVESVRDGRSAIRWVKANAAEIGVDAARVGAGGGSAGGHVALCAVRAEDCDDETDDLSVSCNPGILILFNPATNTISIESRMKKFGDLETARRLSPLHHVSSGFPPCIIFHGVEDKTVPIGDARAFRGAMEARGNVCQLMEYEGMGHGFFNYGRNGNVPFAGTLRAADRFLVRHGWLAGEPAI